MDSADECYARNQLRMVDEDEMEVVLVMCQIERERDGDEKMKKPPRMGVKVGDCQASLKLELRGERERMSGLRGTGCHVPSVCDAGVG